MSDFRPENDLEQLLVHAATGRAAGPQFFRRLLDANVFFLTAPQHEERTSGVLAAGSRLPLAVWKDQYGDVVPFFSSYGRVEETSHRH